MCAKTGIEMTKKIVVTGGTGFIGKNLCARLVEEGWDVTDISIDGYPVANVKNIKCNILDSAAITPIIENADIVVHLAAITGHDAIVNRPFETLELDYTGTRNVLNAFVRGKGEHFIYTSTGKVYGKPVYLPYDEEHPTKPSTISGKSKLITEKLLDFYSYFSQKCFSILRIFNVYGPGQGGSFLFPTIMRQLAQPKIVLGDMKPMRDYIYIDDVVEAFMAVIRNRVKGMNILNVGSGKSYSAQQIIDMIEKITGIRHEIISEHSRYRKDEYDDERADTEKLARLGWHAVTDLETGLRKTLDSWKAK